MRAASVEKPITLHYVTRHVVERYRELHPEAKFDDVLQAYESGTRVNHDVVVCLLGRRPRNEHDPKHESNSTYVVCPSRLGVFVVSGGSMTTYLRLGLTQQRWVREMYPVDAGTSSRVARAS